MRLPPLYGAAIFQDTCVALIKKVRVGGVESTYIHRFILTNAHHPNRENHRLVCVDTLENSNSPF